MDKQKLIRFEEEIAELFNDGKIRSPVHLYHGNEDKIIDYAVMNSDKKLVEMSLNEFGDELSKNSVAPGGGSVSALVGNLGSALISMVAAVTFEKKGFEGSNHLYVTFATNDSNNLIPNWLVQKYPAEMTIVIQHEYYHLSVNKKNFNIGLSFNNKKSNLTIFYDSIISFADPSANFGLNYKIKRTVDYSSKKKLIEKKKPIKNNNSSNVIKFSNYKKN